MRLLLLTVHLPFELRIDDSGFHMPVTYTSGSSTMTVSAISLCYRLSHSGNNMSNHHQITLWLTKLCALYSEPVIWKSKRSNSCNGSSPKMLMQVTCISPSTEIDEDETQCFVNWKFKSINTHLIQRKGLEFVKDWIFRFVKLSSVSTVTDMWYNYELVQALKRSNLN